MMIRVLLITICCLFFLSLLNLGWADVTKSQLQLEKINARIEHAEANLKNKKQSELNISRELALIKKTLQRTDQRVAELKKDQKKLRGKISQQKQLIKGSQQNVRKIGHRLEKRLVALYKEGETGPLKILFSADSPTEMVQQYHYLTKVLQYDKELLAEYRDAIQIQKQHLAGLESLEQRKVEFLEREQQQRQVIREGRRLQSRLLKQARVDKKKFNRELVLLKEKAARLKSLIGRLDQEPELLTGPVARNFAVGRGKLGWPVNGRIVIGYGTQKDTELGTYYESNGIEIAVPLGSPVRAIATGKVVFADYFKGYGNLFILSHPGGYHTLYAQTDRMQKKLGDQVSAGDLLGYSGLAGRDSVYFEIRSKGTPVNPLSWLKRR